MLNYRMGMITENYDFLEPDQINQEREKRSINHINKEVILLTLFFFNFINFISIFFNVIYLFIIKNKYCKSLKLKLL